MLQQPNLFQSNGKHFSEGVHLFVFTPRSHGAVIMRPQTFAFNEQTVNELRNARGPQGVAMRYGDPNSNLSQSILPDHHGFQLDTYNYDQYWSFILVIDSGAMLQTDLRYGSPKNRTVLTGYFLDEPFARNTLEWAAPIANPNAKIMFTQESRVTFATMVGHSGSVTQARTSANNDLIPQALSTMAVNANGDLMLTDSGTIAKNVAFDDGAETRYVSDDSALIGNFQKARANPRDIYSPKRQIVGLAKGVENGLIAASTEEEKYSANGQFGMIDSVPQTFMEEANHNVGMHNGPTPVYGSGTIDPSLPSVMQDLDHMWPNMIVHPLKIPSAPQWDVYGQENISPRSTMSNLAVSVISGIAADHRLASIMFRYSSWSPSQISRTAGGVWSIESASPIVEVSDHDFESTLIRFKKELEDSLWPTIIAIHGEFDIMVNFDMSNSTLVNLNYLDDEEKFGSYYEHHNRLGGLAAPNVGDQNTFQFNYDQYTNVLGAIGSSIEGPSTFGKGPEDGMGQLAQQEILNQQYY